MSVGSDESTIRAAVRRISAGFPGEYWRRLDRERQYPAEFVQALSESGFLAVMIPEQYNGSGLNLATASAVMEEIQASGANGAACHAQMYIMGTLRYAKDRVAFGRPIGQIQGVQFPLARAHIAIEAAALMVEKAARLFDTNAPCGTEANMAKLLASEASRAAADVCLQTFGGYGFAEEYDVERKFRETRLYQVAPVSTNLILAHVATHVLGLPRSY
jgi:alkylation response protein AidB-like acyl-CoA dehydrogenase